MFRLSSFVPHRELITTTALIALAALAKVTPLLLLPLLPRRGGAGAPLLAAALFAAAWAPFLWLGAGATGSIATYLGRWADNDSLHAVLRLALPVPATAWRFFSGLVALTYLTYDTHQWRLWISFAEYVPLYGLLAAGHRHPIDQNRVLSASASVGWAKIASRRAV